MSDQPDQVVTAKALQQVLSENATKSDRLWLRSIWVLGGLVMPSSVIQMRLRFENCRFTGPVRLEQAEIPEAILRSCEFEESVWAQQLAVRWDLNCRGSIFHKGLLLDGCNIGGSLILSEGGVSADEAASLPGLSLNGANIKSGCDFGDAFFKGGMMMVDAQIGQQLSLVRTTLEVPSSDGVAIRADRLAVSGGMFCDQIETDGEIRLPNASIGGTLRFTEAQLKGTELPKGSGRCFMADGIEVAADMSLSLLRARGEMRLPGATVGGQLSLSSSFIEADEEGTSLNLDRAQVDSSAFFHDLTSIGEIRMLGFSSKGQLTFRRARLTTAIDGSAPEDALSADGAEIGDGFFLNDARVTGNIRLPGVKIGGDLTLNRAQLRAPQDVGLCLAAEGCNITGDLYAVGLEAKGALLLTGASIHGHVLLRRARIEALLESGPPEALLFDRADIDGGVNMQELRCFGGVRFSGARIGVQLLISRARLECKTGEQITPVVLNVDGGEVDGVIICARSRFLGEIRMIGATVRNQISFSSSFCEARKGGDGSAISLDGLKTSDLLCNQMRARGEVRLVQATVERQVSFDNADIQAYPGQTDSLSADGLQVGGGMSCIALRCHGKLGLFGARIKGQFSLIGARLSAGESPVALGLPGAEVEELILAPEMVEGTVDLRHATAQSLWDAEDGEFAGNFPQILRLEGFKYELREPLDAKRRLQWVGMQPDDRYIPGVYAELADAFRRQGEAGAAREISIAGERHARRKIKRFKPAGLWQDLLWITIGYGYRNWLAAIWLLALALAGGIAFTLSEDSFDPIPRDPPDFNPFLYAVDATVPILDIGQQRAWEAVGLEAWISLFLSIAGYGLATAVIAAATGLFNRDAPR